MREERKGLRGYTAALLALAALASALFWWSAAGARAQQPPALPTIVTGSVTISGQPAPVGTLVMALMEGNNCGDARVRPDNIYVLQVGGRPGNPAPCDQLGANIQFVVADPAIATGQGLAATGSTVREQGALKQGVNLAAAGQPQSIPTPLPTPSILPSAPGAQPPAAAPAGAPGQDDDGSDFVWWPLALVGVALVGIAGVLAWQRQRRGGGS